MIAILLALLAVVNVPNPSVSYVCDGATAVYTVSFPYLSSGDLLVTSTTPAGNVTTLAYTTDFSVNLASTSSTATLTLGSPGTKCPSGNVLKIARNLSLTQPYSFKAQSTYNQNLHETAYDREVMLIQQTDAKVSAIDVKAYVDAAISATLTGGQNVQPITWNLTGDGSTTTFSVPNAVINSPDLYLVTIDGVLQKPATDYTVSSAAGQITFTTAPAYGGAISVRSFGYARALSVGDNTSVLATGTSVPRDLAHWMGDVVNVKAYGAVGGGSVDDTVAIQAAATAAAGKTLYFPTDTYKVSTINISTTSGMLIRGDSAKLTSANECMLQFTGDSTNITIRGMKFSSTTVVGSGVSGMICSFNRNLTNIVVVDNDFTSPSGATNAIKIDQSTVGTLLLGLSVINNRFTSIGQMGVEIINHTFDDISRYEQVRIVDNRFDGLGLASTYGMAVSLSGMGKNNVVANNTISNVKNIGIEIVGPWQTAVANNVLRNLQASVTAISVGKPASAAVKPQGVTISGNIVDGNGGIAFQPTGIAYGAITGNIVTGTGKVSIETSDFMSITGNSMEVTNGIVFLTLSNSAISGNRFSCLTNTVGYNVTITNTTLSTFTGNTFQSERSTGLLVNGTSANNTFVGGIFSNENSAAAGPALQFDGASVTGNISTGAIFRRTAAGGTTWSQSTSAAGNFIVSGLPNTVNPDSVSAPAPITFTTGSNSWVTPMKVNGTFIYVDSANTLRLKTTAPTVDKDGTPTSQPPTSTFAGLGTPGNGTFFYCSDCTIANPCAGAGTGALAKRLNGVWVCN